MKTYLTTLLIGMISLMCSTAQQTPAIEDVTWFVHSIETANTELTHPADTDLYTQINVDLTNNKLIGDLCCGGSFETPITMGFNVFTTDAYTGDTPICNNTNSTTFSNTIKNYFKNGVGDNFYFTTSKAGDFTHLEITNSTGNTINLYNTPLYNINGLNSNTLKLTSTDNLDTWYVDAMQVNGTTYNIQDFVNSEFNTTSTYNQISIEFASDGTFKTEACGILSGQFSIHSDNELTFVCESLTATAVNCQNTTTTNLQTHYFDFFKNNTTEVFNFTYGIVDSEEGCSPEFFRLEAANGDFINFSNCPYTLSSTKHNAKDKLKLYPNPTTDSFFITNNLSVKQIELYNIEGKLIKLFTQPQNTYQISELTKGIYLVKIKQTNTAHITTEKLIIQ
ncbi:MAG: T9SS type A sorting domain-containing protein [Mesonia hippocampi]|uniref:T9SS type A sorting domain-containing protein n=1 Tax=Mesonia hippocampi TaxID=1628250 RepID=UPI003F9B457A